MSWSLEAILNRVNWRMAFIFVPAFASGRWKDMGLYTPFMFGYVLSSARTELFRMTSQGLLSNVKATAMAIAQIIGFIGIVYYFEADGKYLSSFLFSSFLCPVVRHYFPKESSISKLTHGDLIVYSLVVAGLALSWLLQGIDAAFWGIFFLQGVPEVQRYLWMKPTQNILFITVIFGLTAPFTTVGVAAYWFPDWLSIFPQPYLKWLCFFANAVIPDYHAILGVPFGASKQEITRSYRQMSKTCHPDKIPHDTLPDEKLRLTEKFTKIAEANDMLSRERNEGVPELTELQPRCIAAAIFALYWVLHMLMDFVEIEQQREKNMEAFREHITKTTQENMNFNLEVLGCKREDINEYVTNDRKYNGLPYMQHNNLEDLKTMRAYLKEAGYKLRPLPEGLPENTPLILPPPQMQQQQQQQQQQVPGWVQWLQMPEQKDNVLALAFHGNLEELDRALKTGQSPQAMISPGRRTAVYLAAINGHANCIMHLAQLGADVRLPDEEEGFSPLHMAAVHGHIGAVKALLQCKADIKYVTQGIKLAPLHMAAIEAQEETIELLLEAKADINPKDGNGETVLFAAAKANRAATVQLLTEKKAEPNTSNNGNITPLWIAAVQGHAATVAALHAANASTTKAPTQIEPAVLIKKKPEEAATIVGKPEIAQLIQNLERLKGDVTNAKKAAREANKSKLSQDEQIKCLNCLKEATQAMKEAYKDAMGESVKGKEE